jgi:hypothetical protein
VSRDVVPSADAKEICEQLTNNFTDQCGSFLNNHGVGFWNWQATFPVDQIVCQPYTLWIDNVGFVTPTFDTKFNSAKACSTTADFFGALAFFTMAFASCCPLDPSRMACLSIYFFMACLFQGLSLLIFRSNACEKGFFSPYFQNSTVSAEDAVESVSCSLSTGSKLAVAAIVLYFYCMCLVPKAVPPQPVGGNAFLMQQQPQPAADGGDAAERGNADNTPAAS